MLTGALLEAAVSVLAVMILFTLLAAAINETIADNIRNLRGQTLMEVVGNLLERELGKAGTDAAGDLKAKARSLIHDFYTHDEICSLQRPKRKWFSWFWRGREKYLPGKERKPSAIEPRSAALVLLDVLGRRTDLEAKALTQKKEYRDFLLDTIRKLPLDERQKEYLRKNVGDVDAWIEVKMSEFRTSLDAEIARVEADYAELVARAQGWYLRSTRKMLFAIGLVLAIGSNIDILGYAERLMVTENLSDRVEIAMQIVEARQSEAGVGETDAGQAAPPELGKEFDSLIATLGTLKVEVGWVCHKPGSAAEAPAKSAAGNGTATGSSTGPGAGAPAATAGSAEAESSWRLEYIPFSHLPCDVENGQGGFYLPSPEQVIGWLLIAFGVTLGAQFWFDLFKKLVDLRTAGRTVTPKPGS